MNFPLDPVQVHVSALWSIHHFIFLFCYSKLPEGRWMAFNPENSHHKYLKLFFLSLNASLHVLLSHVFTLTGASKLTEECVLGVLKVGPISAVLAHSFRFSLSAIFFKFFRSSFVSWGSVLQYTTTVLFLHKWLTKDCQSESTVEVHVNY